ncbi:MAG: hypothetical protein K6F85_00360 [Bacteroidales bacterium]|nr:hypothetical protein [Bacteroidales bacterium]
MIVVANNLGHNHKLVRCGNEVWIFGCAGTGKNIGFGNIAASSGVDSHGRVPELVAGQSATCRLGLAVDISASEVAR